MLPKNFALTQEQAYQKLIHYSLYKERCHLDVKEKMFQLNVAMRFHDQLIADLIESGYINELRYAKAYVNEQFSLYKWGKGKIISGLKLKQISAYCTKEAINQIDEEDYFSTAKNVAEKYGKTITKVSPVLRKRKLATYLQSRGFDSKMIEKIIEEE